MEMIVLLVLAAVAVGGYYGVYSLAQAGIFLVEVKEGWCRIHMRRGHYVRTLGPGWHWIGLPGINTLYGHKMVFKKSVTAPDGNAIAEPHPTEAEVKMDGGLVSSVKTTVYPYAVPVKDAEDSNGLPLKVLLTVPGRVTDYQKAFFSNSDWYARVDSAISTVLNAVVEDIDYDVDVAGKKEKGRKTIAERLWEMLIAPRGDRPSVRDEVLDSVGFEIYPPELRSIDPPDGYRKKSLAAWEAEQDAQAAEHEAKAESARLSAIDRRMTEWVAAQKKDGEGLADTVARLKEDGSYRLQYETYKQLMLSNRGAYRRHDYAGPDGKTLTNLQYVGGDGGGGFGVLGGGKKGDRRRDGDRGSDRGKGGKERRDPRGMTDEELERAAFGEEDEK